MVSEQVADLAPFDVYTRLDQLHRWLNVHFTLMLSDGVVSKNEALQLLSALEQVYSEIQPVCAEETRVKWVGKFKDMRGDITGLPNNFTAFPKTIYEGLRNLQDELKQLQNAHNMFLPKDSRSFENRVAFGSRR